MEKVAKASNNRERAVPEDGYLRIVDHNSVYARGECGLQVEFSACNRFLAYFNPPSINRQDLPKMAMYRLESTYRKSATQINIPANIDLSKASHARLVWHPQSPIISVVIWENFPDSQAEEILETYSCHTWNVDDPNANWMKAGQTYTRKSAGMRLNIRLIL